MCTDSPAMAGTLVLCSDAVSRSKLRENARGALASRALERAADAQRRRLPERLRWKTERHPFQWVALDGEQLVAGRLSKAIGWDLRRWLGAGDATVASGRGLRWYFVLPDRPEAC